MDTKRALMDKLGEDRVSDDPDDLSVYGTDWTRVFKPAPSLLLRPRSTEEVSTILAYANEHRLPIVPSGGRTGLAAGAVAKDGELVLSLERMKRIDPVDTSGMTVRVQAGAVTQAVHDHCAEQGMVWPVDFASKGSSQVGGNISTNAGGVKVIRYGGTRNWVLGLQVVLASGEVLELNGALEKNNTGLELRQLFIGSEGTLGVVTEATLKLTRLTDTATVMLFAVEDLSQVLGLFRAVRKAPFLLNAFEFFTDRCLNRVMRHRRLSSPLSPASHYALVEVEARTEEERDEWLAELLDSGRVLDGTVAQTQKQARQLWEFREGISESLGATGFPHKNDIALPVAALEGFCGELQGVFDKRYPDWELCLFGHIGDGNVHVNVMKPDDMEPAEFFKQAKEADGALFDLLRSYGGSVSAEHGIGLLKKPWLLHTRSAPEVQLMRSIKSTMDPNGILNPGKIFD